MSGLAGKIRRVEESDEFDLANYDAARCDELVKAALAEPLAVKEMVKLSFVVGGGKLVRQKYIEELPRIFMSSLSQIGYRDDSSASLESEGGCYKYQHDTAKNLKFVHVFPLITVVDKNEAETDAQERKPPSRQDILLRCEKDMFEKVVNEHLPTYAQKKYLLDLMKERISHLEEIEGKLANLERLELFEEEMFDDVGVEDLRAKVKILGGLMQVMVDETQLTQAEKAQVLETLDAKAKALNEEIKKAEAEEKAKKKQAIRQQLETLQATRQKVKESCPVSLPPLRHGTELQSLYAKMKVVERLEKQSLTAKLTLEELKKVGEKGEIEEAIQVLEQRSRGWFEEDAVFNERKQICMRAAPAPRRPAQPARSKETPWRTVQKKR